MHEEPNNDFPYEKANFAIKAYENYLLSGMDDNSYDSLKERFLSDSSEEFDMFYAWILLDVMNRLKAEGSAFVKLKNAGDIPPTTNIQMAVYASAFISMTADPSYTSYCERFCDSNSFDEFYCKTLVEGVARYQEIAEELSYFS